MSWPHQTVNMPLILWGILLIIGFLLTHMFVYFQISHFIVYSLLWVIIIFSGFTLNYKLAPEMKKQKFNVNSAIWFILLIIGFTITGLIYVRVILLNPYYLGAIWFVIIGISLLITEGMIKKDKPGLITAITYLLFSIPAFLFWEVSFVILAMGFGIPMILSGLYSVPIHQ